MPFPCRLLGTGGGRAPLIQLNTVGMHVNRQGHCGEVRILGLITLVSTKQLSVKGLLCQSRTKLCIQASSLISKTFKVIQGQLEKDTLFL